jgi:hypothetical protein
MVVWVNLNACITEVRAYDFIKKLTWPFGCIADSPELAVRYKTPALPCQIIAAASWIERAGPQLYSVLKWEWRRLGRSFASFGVV